MPFVPFVRVPNVDAAIALAKKYEHGFKHTAIIHSRNVETITRMGRELDTSLFIQNGPSMAGLGIGGEGYLSLQHRHANGRGSDHTAHLYAAEKVNHSRGHASAVALTLRVRESFVGSTRGFQMQIGIVVGQGIATVKHPSLVGWRLLLVQPVTSDGKEDGEPLLAIDKLGAGMGGRVLLSNDGAGAGNGGDAKLACTLDGYRHV